MPHGFLKRFSLDHTVVRFAIILAPLLFVALIFDFLHRTVGDVSAALILLPISAAGIVYGVRGGLAMGLTGILMLGYLFGRVGETSPDAFIVEMWPGTLMGLLAGAITGWLGDLTRQAQRQSLLVENEMAERKRAEALLRQAQEHLELRVQERSAELEQANAALQAQMAERNQAETKIREQNKFLSSVIEAMSYPFYVIDPRDYAVKMANKAACADRRWEGTTCYSLVHKNTRPCAELGIPCPVDMVLSTKAPVVEEHLHPDEQGNPKYFQVYASPILDASGEVQRIIEYTVDISANKEAEEALEAGRERLAITLRSLGDAVITTDQDERIVLFNPAAEELTGWTQADAVGQHLLDVFHLINLKTRGTVADPARHAMASGEIVGLVEHTGLVAKDGTERFISSSVAPIRDRMRQVTGVVLVFRDITRLKQAEEALRDSQEYSHNLIDSSLDMIIAVDNDRRIVEFNKAALRTFGYTPEEILGQDVTVLYADVAGGAAVHQQTIENGTCVQQVWNRRKNGQVFPCFLSASTLRDAQGRVAGFMGVSRDITDRKLAEEQNAKAERLAALGRMAAALAHEINNPLQAIRGTLDLVLDFPLGLEEREENLRIVRQEIERLSEVTARVLQFARPAKSPRHLVSLAAVLQQTLALAGKQLQHAHVQVITDFLETPPVAAAPEQLSQVFINLVLNAIEAIGDQGCLRISAHAESTQAVITFENDGPPISPEAMLHMFEPFFTTKKDGSGLGLSVSHSLVEQHGGELTVRNLDDGLGVVFTVRLPLTRPDLLEPADARI